MKNFLTFFFIAALVVVMTTLSVAQVPGDFRSLATGNWSATGSWERLNSDGITWEGFGVGENTGTGLPASSSSVFVLNTHTITINQNASIVNLTVGGGTTGILQYEDITTVRTLTISGNLTVNSGAAFNLGTQTNNVEHLFNIAGNIILANTSTLNIGSGSTKGVITNFNKGTAGDQTISSPGTPTSVIFGKVKLNRPSSSEKVLCSVSMTSKGGNLAMQLITGTWEQSAGTWSGPAATATNLQLDQPNGHIVLSGSGSMSITSSTIGIGGSNGYEGSITVNTTGTFTVGALSNQARLQPYSNTGVLNVIAGTVNVGGRLTITGTANISGGVINIYPQGAYTALGATSNAFEVSSGTGNFTMSSGIITIANPIAATGNGLEMKFSTSGTYNISGGTIRIGDGVSTTAGADGFQVSTHTVPLWNLEINGNNSIPGRAVTLTDATAARHLVVKNNLTINSGTLFANYGTGSNITLGGAFSNSGIFTPASTATFTFNGSSPQITNILPASVGNLVLNNSAGITITNPITVSNTLTLSGNNNYTNLSNVSGYAGLTYSATVGQTTGLELPSSISNLTINNANGVALGGNTSVSGAFALTNGLFTLGTNNLTLGSTATLSGGSATSYVDVSGAGVFKKELSADGVYAFPIGNAVYSPVLLTLSGGSYSSASIAVDAFNVKHPQNMNPTDYLNRYWRVTAIGITLGSYNADFIYDDGDIAGTEASMVLGRYDGSWSIAGTVNTGTNTLSGTGLTNFSDFTGGEGGALPIELSNFNCSLKGNSVQLTWKTTSEVNSSMFEVQKKLENTEWTKVGEVSAAGNSNSPKDYTFIDKNISVGTSLYRLKMIDADGRFEYSNVVEAEIKLPNEYTISQNYPNPFNPTTRIDYQLPFDSKVAVELYGITGEKIATLINSDLSAGYYTADINASALNLVSGVYIYRMTASGGNNQSFTQVKKLMLTK
jgi:hypothetical protein